MSWTLELRQAFAALRAGRPARVEFTGQPGKVGEIGEEFNQLAAALVERGANGWSREQSHALRNRLAGLLAMLHLLRLTAPLTPEELDTLGTIVLEAKELDAQLRAR
ncbi:MAG TPA: hypothetical protein VNN18_03800 [Candidatus Xenobia bacterium]|nr:hypothetical protein [Candidatus Xenobia bacterium]